MHQQQAKLCGVLPSRVVILCRWSLELPCRTCFPPTLVARFSMIWWAPGKVTGGRNGYGAKLTNVFSRSLLCKYLGPSGVQKLEACASLGCCQEICNRDCRCPVRVLNLASI